MTYLWFALTAAVIGAAVAGHFRWPGQSVASAIGAALLVAAVRAAQPTLFRAENGLGFAFVAFGLPAALIGLVVGLVARDMYRSRPVPPVGAGRE
jgi:hypothetical protein